MAPCFLSDLDKGMHGKETFVYNLPYLLHVYSRPKKMQENTTALSDKVIHL